MNGKFEKIAFTLAEVLITLAIIGVVAALTIPTVVRNYQKQQYVTAAAKAITVMQQGLRQMMVNSNCTNLECTGLFATNDKTDEDWNNKIDAAVKKAFKVQRSFKNDDDKSDIKETVKYFNIDNSYIAFEDGYQFVTTDGIIFSIDTAGCVNTAHHELSKFKKHCLSFEFDSNGKKGPNQFGKDVFGDIRVSNEGISYPASSYEWAMGMNGKANDMASNYWRANLGQCGVAGLTFKESGSSVSGQNCLARIMEEGWRITYF